MAFISYGSTSMLTNLTTLITANLTTNCTLPSQLVTDPSGVWNSNLNEGAGGMFVRLCATYATDASSPIRNIQAAGLNINDKPDCDYAAGFTAVNGNLNAGSRNPGNASLCIQRDSEKIPITSLYGTFASTGCRKHYRAVSSAESRSIPYNFDSAGKGVVLCVPDPRPPLPPPPPGPRTPITDLHVFVATNWRQMNFSCPDGLELVRPLTLSDKWDLDFNSGAGGSYAYLCVGRNHSAKPILSLLGFHTPSAADPFENCPGNYTKVLGNGSWIGSNDLNHGSLNVGAMYLCYRRDVGRPYYDLAGISGGGNASNGAGCEVTHWEAIHGPPAYPGVFNFDPKGVGLTLCADRSP